MLDSFATRKYPDLDGAFTTTTLRNTTSPVPEIDRYPDWITWTMVGVAIVEAIICIAYNNRVEKRWGTRKLGCLLHLFGLLYWAITAVIILTFALLTEPDTALRVCLFILGPIHVIFILVTYYSVKKNPYFFSGHRRSSLASITTSSTNDEASTVRSVSGASPRHRPGQDIFSISRPDAEHSLPQYQDAVPGTEGAFRAGPGMPSSLTPTAPAAEQPPEYSGGLVLPQSDETQAYIYAPPTYDEAISKSEETQ